MDTHKILSHKNKIIELQNSGKRILLSRQPRPALVEVRPKTILPVGRNRAVDRLTNKWSHAKNSCLQSLQKPKIGCYYKALRLNNESLQKPNFIAKELSTSPLPPLPQNEYFFLLFSSLELAFIIFFELPLHWCFSNVLNSGDLLPLFIRGEIKSRTYNNII